MYRVVVGIEVHVQIKTKTKAFCRCLNTISIEPNKNICPICIGEPGTLPELNRQMVIKSLTAALALHCKINQTFHFDRKNYFYPDLPKGYQITQYEVPIGYDGYLTIFTDDSSKRIGIERIHEGCRTSCYQQIGNAVPVLLAQTIAKKIKEEI
ncbi:MAG TPA: hypothetical protein PK449_06240 [Exilispira sp.]|nr:hypothetical protein [Exilispira sp.]